MTRNEMVIQVKKICDKAREDFMQKWKKTGKYLRGEDMTGYDKAREWALKNGCTQQGFDNYIWNAVCELYERENHMAGIAQPFYH